MIIELKLIGIALVMLGGMHVMFPRYFKWKSELSSLSLINQQIFKVHTFFIGLTVVLMGLLCISSSNELISTTLGKRISLGLFVFWGLRLIFQFAVYSKKLWRGKKLETLLHVLASAFWIYLTLVFARIYFFHQAG